MSAQEDRENAFGDFAAFLKALLPSLQACTCHDTRGQVFWSSSPAGGMPALSDEYNALLTRLLGGDEVEGDQGCVDLGDFRAYVLPLEGDGRRRIGALTVLLGLQKTPPLPEYDDLVAQVAPAHRSLQRELALRLRVLESHRRLKVQAAEEQLLHQVEKILHEPQPCDTALAAILKLCCERLGVPGAFVYLPDKGLSIAEGCCELRSDLGAKSQQLLAQTFEPGFDMSGVHVMPKLLWRAVHAHGQVTQGVFALCNWKDSAFSERRLLRVARYVGSHIDSLLDRNFDAVTGLTAWPLLERELRSATAEEEHHEHVVMSLDIDQLHVVNDSFGREAGDEVLARFGILLREVLCGHMSSRMTGDNFAALLRNTSIDKARRLAETICARFRENVYQRGDQTHRPTVSIGIGPLESEDEAGGGLALAQVACQMAKERGRARVEVYESADLSIIRRVDDIQMVGYVRNAIENNRLALVAQPLMALKHDRVHYYHEVLVRIVNEAGDHVLPGEFMSAAERYQLMEELDRWVVATTLRSLSSKGPHLRGGDARFAINLSGQSLGSRSFLGFVEKAIRDSGVPPDVIAFEITETVAVARMQQAQNFMQALKRIGCRFSLDDFGTGLSSFAYLKLFPIDTLKIDGSFIRDLTTNVVSQSVVAAIAEVARVMQLETVAEYVQEQEAVDLLRNLNISYAQGYFVGRPEMLETAISGLDELVVSGMQRSLPAESSA